MGTVEDCREMFKGSVETEITPFSPTDHIGSPVAYKLVRVAGDGRLVAATDEEILEVNETDMNTTSDSCQTLCYLPAESFEGLLQSDIVEPYIDQVNSQLEYNKETLQKVEQEPMLGITYGSEMPSTPSNDEVQVHHEEALLQEPIPCSSDVPIGCKVEPCLNAEASPKETASPDVAVAAQKPDFSLVRGEICLDNLPIKALQETFRATFGRVTTVKDKTWLKRRITMGLINSCNVPTTNLTIKDNKLVRNQEKSKDASDLRATNSKDAPSGRLSVNHYCATDGFSSEERAAKRVRKPTRRYIEETSETDDKQQNDNSKDHQRVSEKPEVRSISVSSGKRVTVTRMVSLAGSEIEVPYVSHVRRSRPRENVMALMECHSSCLEAKASAGESNRNLVDSEVMNQGPVQKEFVTSLDNSEEQEHVLTEVDHDMEPEYIDSSGNSSGSDDNNNNNVGVTIMQGGGVRRKHHRAWTLSEVTKLVEGVSKYGPGKWSEIKKLSFSSFPYRTAVDLKDKWRNLLKASCAQTLVPSNNMVLKKHGSMHIPTEILLQVKELAEKQPQVPSGVSKIVVGDSDITETRSDLL